MSSLDDILDEFLSLPDQKWHIHESKLMKLLQLHNSNERVNEEKWSECIKVSVKRNILKVLCKVVNLKAVIKTINGRLHLVRVDGDTEEAGVGVD